VRQHAGSAGASVTFGPGARSAWHTYPLGQTLIVTSGVGQAQRWGPVEEIRLRDVVSFPSGEKHWHGAAPTTAMTHIAIQEKLDGKPVDWWEHVTPAYRAARSEARLDSYASGGLLIGVLQRSAETPTSNAWRRLPEGATE
jgi:quercetin dioxygenase-like cupin family protein